MTLNQRTKPAHRHRLSADVPAGTDARVRETARRYFRGPVTDAVTAALETFQWIVDARGRGLRVVATDTASLPAAYEETVIAGLDASADDWTWLVARRHPMAPAAVDQGSRHDRR